MSKKDLTRIIERAATDVLFVRQMVRDAQTALAGYSLTSDERAALIAGDAKRLEALSRSLPFEFILGPAATMLGSRLGPALRLAA